MKLFILCIVSVAVITCVKAANHNDFDVLLESQWHNLENDEQRAHKFGGKWILAGTITFTKKAKDTVHLSKLYLQWNGSSIEQLTASLYCTDDRHEKFIPLQQNLLCDGLWNTTRQTLIFNFDKKLTLGLSNKFYVVLTVPTQLETIVQHGNFTLLNSNLPEPYQVATRDRVLSLTFATPSLKKSHAILAAHSPKL